MGRSKVYFLTRDVAGDYNPDWVDVSKYVISIGAIKQHLDSTNYDIGVLRNSQVDLVLNNESGIFSEPLETYSMFGYTRQNTKVKITWQPGNKDLRCGFFKADDKWAIISEEMVIFTGILDDTGTYESIIEQNIKFTCLGGESVLDTVGFDTGKILDWALFSEVIFAGLNDESIRKILSVAVGNISVSLDEEIDTKAPFTNKTVFDVIKDILIVSNSVLYVDIHLKVSVTSRAASADLKHTFYGLGSLEGICRILYINYVLGKNRIFNHVSWRDRPVLSTDNDSIALHGVNKKELSFDFITDDGKRLDITDAIVDEFKAIKKELTIGTVLDVDTAALKLLDKVNVDYPGLMIDPSDLTAFYGSGKYGVHVYATELNNLKISPTTEWKILSRSINLKDEVIEFKLREC